MSKKNYPIIIEQDAHGYVATCPAIQGCYTQASTYERVISNIKDAIKLCVEDMSDREERELAKGSKSLSLASIEI